MKRLEEHVRAAQKTVIARTVYSATDRRPAIRRMATVLPEQLPLAATPIRVRNQSTVTRQRISASPLRHAAIRRRCVIQAQGCVQAARQTPALAMTVNFVMGWKRVILFQGFVYRERRRYVTMGPVVLPTAVTLL